MTRATTGTHLLSKNTKKLTYDQYTMLKTVLYCFAFATHFVPAGYAIPHSLFVVWRLADCAVSGLTILFYLFHERISVRWVTIILALCTYYFISTIFIGSDGRWSWAVFYFIDVAGFVTLLEYGFSRDFEIAIKAFLIVGVVLCSAHFITFLQYRNVPYGMRFDEFGVTLETVGTGAWFFFKHDNGSFFYFFPVMVGLWYQAYGNRRYLYPAVVFTIATLYMYWYQWSVAAMLASTLAAVLFGWLYFTQRPSIFRWMNYKVAVFGGVAFCLFIIVAISGDATGWFSNLFNKSGDLGRGRIWDSALPAFFENPLFGVGFESDETSIARLGINHCHNVILQILYTGGVVTAFFFIVFLLACDVKKDLRNETSKGIACLFIAIFITFIVSTFDWYLYIPFFFFVFILSHYASLQQ